MSWQHEMSGRTLPAQITMLRWRCRASIILSSGAARTRTRAKAANATTDAILMLHHQERRGAALLIGIERGLDGRIGREVEAVLGGSSGSSSS